MVPVVWQSVPPSELYKNCSLAEFVSTRFGASSSSMPDVDATSRCRFIQELKTTTDGISFDQTDNFCVVPIRRAVERITPPLPIPSRTEFEVAAQISLSEGDYARLFKPIIPNSPFSTACHKELSPWLRLVATVALIVEIPFRYLLVGIGRLGLVGYSLYDADWAAYLRFRLICNQHVPGQALLRNLKLCCVG